MSDPNTYTVGWICALSTEYTAARCFLDEKHEQPTSVAAHDGNIYTVGKMGNHNVVIAVMPEGVYGTTSAAAVARDMLHSFPNVRIGLMVGIGGGAPSAKNDIRLGDIVIGSPTAGEGGVMQYDMGKAMQGQGFKATGSLNQPPRLLLSAVSALKAEYQDYDGDRHKIVETVGGLLQKKKRLNRQYGKPDPSTDVLYVSTKVHGNPDRLCDVTCAQDKRAIIQRPERAIDVEEELRIFHGLIGSANQVMKDATIRDRLAAEKNVLCFEMEAAGLMNHFPCLVIRGICDYSDSHKNKAWQGYAAMVAAAYARDLLDLIAPNKVELEQKISKILGNVQQQVAQVGQSLVLARQDVAAIKSNIDDNKENDTLDWIAPDDYAHQHDDILSRRQPGTAQWILNHPEFKEWFFRKGGSLFCRGMPGAGKTVLTAVVVDHFLRLKRESKDGSALGVAYLYCSFSQQERQTPEYLLSSMLKHLSQGCSPLPESVKQLHKKYKGARTRPPLSDILVCIESVVERCTPTYIFVDALDECSRECRLRLLKVLFHLRDLHGANIFTTSRPDREIEMSFPSTSILEIKADANDVGRYLDAHMVELPRFVGAQPDLQERIKAAIMAAACGMFLLVRLYLSSLKKKETPRQIEEALADHDKRYEDLYKEIMNRIEKSEQASFAKKALSWVARARRPLTTSELLHALAESDIVRLIHHTAEEYLRSDSGKRRIRPDAEAYIANTCVTYLSFDDFANGFCATDKDFETRLREYPLYGYAARNWGYHAREACLSSNSSKILRDFLGSSKKTEAAGQAMLVVEEYMLWPGYSQEIPSGAKGLHLAVQFAAADIINDLLDREETSDRNVQDGQGRTPLMWAVLFENVKITQLLLDRGADPNLKDKDGQTPLSLASQNGLTPIVAALLESGLVDMSSEAQKDNEDLLPLSWAARNGHMDSVRLLLTHSDPREGQADSALLWVISGGDEAVVELIVQTGLQRMDAGWKDRVAPKALCLAAQDGQLTMVLLLLRTLGADLDCRESVGLMTPLMKAAQYGHGDVVRELLGRGANPGLEDSKGRTAFSLAVGFGRDTVVSILLADARDAINVDGKEMGGRTPLSLAAGCGYEDIVKILLELEDAVDVDSRDTYKQTPLLWAAEGGHTEIVRQLLNTGRADVNAASLLGHTPLSKAIDNLAVDTVNVLKEHGAKIAVKEVEDKPEKEDKGSPLGSISPASHCTVSTEGQPSEPDAGSVSDDSSELEYSFHSDEEESWEY
ncbi:hypothetical protein B0J18DRAFT_467135 [Chaetomium sp. MPI-SDFR-AT-0129]|nr:hypothetical protein B0J18DRAFT_467135 [Chaetomium sp. MPI-SDFR-AT-0129]